jgi:DNA polymerase (family 10)
MDYFCASPPIPVTNRQLIKAFRLVTSLQELHEEPEHRIRPYQNVVFALEKLPDTLEGMPAEELSNLDGIGKTLAARIAELNETGSFKELSELLARTPEGLLNVLQLKGIGPKKIRTLWTELGVESLQQLKEACETGSVARLKGFGTKTQETLLQSVEYVLWSQGRELYADVEPIALSLLDKIREMKGVEQAEIAGDFRRCLEIVDVLQFVVATDAPLKLHPILTDIPELVTDPIASGPLAWRGMAEPSGIKVEVHFVSSGRFAAALLQLTGSPAHLTELAEGQKAQLITLLNKPGFTSEEEIYQAAGLSYIEPELREGQGELEWATAGKLPRLLELTDLRGPLHNHSTYSDGAHSLREMAGHAKKMGYEYLGMADHSKTAFYANGLQEHRVAQQQQEIDELNKELAPFRIFKGIESDILGDGSLDYSDEVLASFDYVVASIHSNLTMEEQKATERLITAIRNPYTTILGHPTGRLLLRREGYPIDHKAVIDACAKEGVVIEINANPWRLDLDWRWVRYALSKGVMLSINPDAHEMDGYLDMKYGVLVARKGGLTREMTLNALSREALTEYFIARKPKKKKG